MAKGETMKNDAVKERMQDALAELRTLRDEIRVDLHLAGMDLRDEWSVLEKRLPDGAAAARLREATREAVDGLTQELRAFKQRLRARQEPGELARVMTHVLVSCSPADTVAQAIAKMWEADIGWLPVLDQRRLTGILTDRDACVAAWSRGCRMDDLTVASVMSREPVACSSTASIEEALATMRRRQVRRLPVVDGQGQVVGVVTLGDLARAQASHPDRARAHGPELLAALAATCAPRSTAN
jgi:CBS domain-containing protein